MTMEAVMDKNTGGWRSSNLVQAWLVLVLAVGFGVSLAGVQLALGPVIESNKTNETLEKVPELVLGKAPWLPRWPLKTRPLRSPPSGERSKGGAG
jgi:hypothetical protein